MEFYDWQHLPLRNHVLGQIRPKHFANIVESRHLLDIDIAMQIFVRSSVTLLASKSSAQCHQVFSPFWEILSQFWLYKISEFLECQGQDLDRQDDHPRRRGRVTWLCPIKVTTWYVQTIGNPHESTDGVYLPAPVFSHVMTRLPWPSILLSSSIYLLTAQCMKLHNFTAMFMQDPNAVLTAQCYHIQWLSGTDDPWASLTIPAIPCAMKMSCWSCRQVTRSTMWRPCPAWYS